MIKYKKITFASVAVLVLIIFGFGGALSALAVWQDAPPDAPNCDPLTHEGCNPPINVGSAFQTKVGTLGLGDSLFLTTGKAMGTYYKGIIDFASELKFLGGTERVPNSSLITSGIWGAPKSAISALNDVALNINGAALLPKKRLVQIWDNLLVRGHIQATGNMYATNYYTYTCPTSGACTSTLISGGTGVGWALNGKDIYNTNTGNVGIGTATPTPSAKLEVAGLTKSQLLFVTGTADFGDVRFSPGRFETLGITVLGQTPPTAGGAIGIYASSILAGNKALHIFGSGSGKFREVKIWDNLDVVSTTTTKNLVAINICPNPNSCVSTTQIIGSGGLWKKTGTNIISQSVLTDKVGIGTSAPTVALDVVGDICFTKTDNTRSCLRALNTGSGLPTGTTGQTLRHNGTAWVTNSNIYNTGTQVGIGTTALATGIILNVKGSAVIDNLSVPEVADITSIKSNQIAMATGGVITTPNINAENGEIAMLKNTSLTSNQIAMATGGVITTPILNATTANITGSLTIPGIKMTTLASPGTCNASTKGTIVYWESTTSTGHFNGCVRTGSNSYAWKQLDN